MISKYPNFSPIDLKVQDEITNFTHKYEPYSDFSFINLFSWNTNGRAGIAWLNNNLVIKLPDYLKAGQFIYSILGTNKMDDSLRILLDDVPQLDLVPEIVIGSIKHHGGLALAEDRGSFDYVYFLKKLADMSGKKYKNKRNLFNSTKEILGSRLETTTTNTITPSLQQEMLAIFRAWEKHSTQPIQKVRLEYIAINRLLSNSDHFNLHLTLCRIDGKLNGFSIHEVINKTYTLCHFEKSLNDVYLGAGVVLINEAAQSLVKKSKIVNWEQDLGLSGLKKAKQSYVPTKYFKKYWISRGA